MKLLLATLALIALPACQQDTPAESEPARSTAEFDFTPGGPITDAELAEFHVVMAVELDGEALGDLAFELDSVSAPKGARRFLRTTAEGMYDGTQFLRILREFVVQGGDASGSGVGRSPWGTLEPEVSFESLSMGYGTLALTEPASMQFFVVVAESPNVWALENRPITRLGRLVSGVDTLEAIADLPVSFGNDGERSRPKVAPVVTSAKVVRAPAPESQVPIQRKPVELHGQPEIVVVEQLWVTFAEQGFINGITRSIPEARERAQELLARLHGGELAWETALIQENDDELSSYLPIPRRRMSNYGVLALDGQRVKLEAKRGMESYRMELAELLRMGEIGMAELQRRQAERQAEWDERVTRTYTERREDISETHYTKTAFELEVGEIGLVEYDPYGSPRGWYLLKRVE